MTKPSLLSRAIRKLKRDILPPPLEPEIPPLKINFNQGGVRGRRDYIRKFKEDACLKELPFLKRLGLTPDSTLLDYGCGFARLGYAASRYLSPAGAYYGYEPNQTALAFIARAYANRPNFHFSGRELSFEDDYVAVRYNEDRKDGTPSTNVDLSFVDRPIDVQWTSSVFSHMWSEPIVTVLKQMNTLLASGGLCANTWICVDDHASYVMRCGLADRSLPYKVQGAMTPSLENPLACTGYDLETVRDIYRRAGHTIEDILWGSWSGRDNGATYLDIIISRPAR